LRKYWNGPPGMEMTARVHAASIWQAGPRGEGREREPLDAGGHSGPLAHVVRVVYDSRTMLSRAQDARVREVPH
jgi:hypothetical protein